MEKFKNWKRSVIIWIAQGYANMIVSKLESSKNEWEFYYWLEQGASLNARMIVNHEIYLD